MSVDFEKILEDLNDKTKKAYNIPCELDQISECEDIKGIDKAVIAIQLAANKSAVEALMLYDSQKNSEK